MLVRFILASTAHKQWGYYKLDFTREDLPPFVRVKIWTLPEKKSFEQKR